MFVIRIENEYMQNVNLQVSEINENNHIQGNRIWICENILLYEETNGNLNESAKQGHWFVQARKFLLIKINIKNFKNRKCERFE